MNNFLCPKCQKRIEAESLRCGWCNFVADSRKELWKNANMGKQRTKPVANRTGKARFK